MKRMKRIKFYLCVICTVTLLTSCGFIKGLMPDPMMKVQSGMTKDEIVKLLGKPTNRSFEGTNEKWEYSKKKTDRIIIIEFANSVVSKMETYNKSDLPQPTYVAPVQVAPVQ